MLPDKAFDYLLEIVEEICQIGIKVEIKPWEPIKSILEKYGGKPKRATVDKWCNIDFFPKTKEERDLIHEKQKSLSYMGIQFDSGGGCDDNGQFVLDWETDWSFCYTGQPDAEREHNIDVVQDMIEEIKENNG